MTLMNNNSSVAIPSDHVGGRKAAGRRRERRWAEETGRFRLRCSTRRCCPPQEQWPVRTCGAAECDVLWGWPPKHSPPDRGRGKRKTQQRWLSASVKHSSMCISIERARKKGEQICHLHGHRNSYKRKGTQQKEQVKCFSLFSHLHACLCATKAFALHIFTKPTSALFFMPNSCHRVSGIYGL